MLPAAPAVGAASDFGVAFWRTHEGGGLTENDGLASTIKEANNVANTAKTNLLQPAAKERRLAFVDIGPFDNNLM